jgi:hypothetical protein
VPIHIPSAASFLSVSRFHVNVTLSTHATPFRIAASLFISLLRCTHADRSVTTAFVSSKTLHFLGFRRWKLCELEAMHDLFKTTYIQADFVDFLDEKLSATSHCLVSQIRQLQQLDENRSRCAGSPQFTHVAVCSIILAINFLGDTVFTSIVNAFLSFGCRLDS